MSSNGFGVKGRLLLGVFLAFIDSPLRGRTRKFISPLCQVNGIVKQPATVFIAIKVHGLEKGAARPK